ncbi:hypothetical protein IMZ48_25620 [Candidatus Bathyarchaeota archaeon]|nr:hypothetical protein [Candidatus Bathyarchaeota archaeon]
MTKFRGVLLYGRPARSRRAAVLAGLRAAWSRMDWMVCPVCRIMGDCTS